MSDQPRKRRVPPEPEAPPYDAKLKKKIEALCTWFGKTYPGQYVEITCSVWQKPATQPDADTETKEGEQ